MVCIQGAGKGGVAGGHLSFCLFLSTYFLSDLKKGVARRQKNTKTDNTLNYLIITLQVCYKLQVTYNCVSVLGFHS